jgi:hypothetical protein
MGFAGRIPLVRKTSIGFRLGRPDLGDCKSECILVVYRNSDYLFVLSMCELSETLRDNRREARTNDHEYM